MTDKKKKLSFHVHSLERGLIVLEYLSQIGTEVPLRKIAAATEFNQSTVHRLLTGLKARGYVHQNPETHEYRPSFKMFEIGSLVVRNYNPRNEARPILEWMAKETGMSALITVREGVDALCVERVDCPDKPQILYLNIGKRMPLIFGGGPRAILANLPAREMENIFSQIPFEPLTSESEVAPEKIKKDLAWIKTNGYAISRNDVLMGTGAVGAPFFDRQGNVYGAASVSGLVHELRDENLQHIIETVKQGASRLTRLYSI